LRHQRHKLRRKNKLKAMEKTDKVEIMKSVKEIGQDEDSLSTFKFLIKQTFKFLIAFIT
jgi:hypothetical protein